MMKREGGRKADGEREKHKLGGKRRVRKKE